MMRKMVTMLVALCVLAVGQVAPTSAHAAAAWYDGSISYSSVINCASIIQGTPYQEYGVGTYVGYRGDSSASSPAPGDVYWLHIVVYGMGNPCSGQYVSPQLTLPPNTSLAIDASHPIQCYATGTYDPGDCPTGLAAGGTNGSLIILSPDTAHARMWPMPQGKNWEWQIPVVSDRPLSGAQFGAYLVVADGNSSPTLAASQNVYVFNRTPAVSYPSGATTGIGATTAVSHANLYSGGLAGTGYFELGTTTSYGLFTDSVTVPAGGPNWQLYSDWTAANGTSALHPATTYHWRFRYVAGGVTSYGADQTFTTAATGTGGGGSTGTSAPVAHLTAQPGWSLGASAPVSWSATAGSAAVTSYDVRYRVATWNGGFGGWISWLSGTGATSARLPLGSGRSYCFSVRAHDASGQVSGWTADSCTTTPTDDRALSASKGWKNVSSSGSYARTVRTTKKAKATLTAKAAWVRRAALVVTLAPGSGSVTVTVGTRKLGTFRLSTSRVRKQVVIALPSVRSTRANVVIKTTSTKTVTIDGLLVAR